MKKPCLVIDLRKIAYNTHTIVNLCRSHGIEVVGVTKGVCAHPLIIKVLQNSGIRKFADARLMNLINLRKAGIEGEFALLRVPMISEAMEAVYHVDLSYQSEIEVIEAFHKAAQKLNKIHKVILMMEVGDLREGIMPNELDTMLPQILTYSHIQLLGLAINIGCFSGLRPSYQHTSILVELKEYLKSKYQLHLPILSGGASTSLNLLNKGELPPGINELRIGEAIFLAGVSSGVTIPGGFHDAFELVADIIEIRDKPSIPIGERNLGPIGGNPHYIDKGIRKRAVFAIGQQDVPFQTITPKLSGIEILGASSDHMIVDITDAPFPLRVGDSVSYFPNYKGLLALMTSPYVEKYYL